MSDNQPAPAATSAISPPDPVVAAVALLTVVTFLLGLQFTDAIPASSALAFIPVLFVAGIAQLILGIVAVQDGQHVIGVFFSVFGPFLLSFALLETGLVHAWWPVPPTDLPHVEGAFLMGWTVLLSIWLLLSVVLPLIFTVLLLLIDVALWTLVAGLWNNTAGLEKTCGWFLLATALGSAYFVASHWLRWEGFDVLPVGKPLVRGARHTSDQV